VADGSGELVAIDPGKRRAWLEGLARVEPGGATDIGALLTEAAGHLDPKRRGAVIYIGDGQPSVGEIAPKALRERLARLPQGTRVLAAGVGVRANVALLQSVARGAPVEPVGDAYGAARTALRLLEAAQRPGLVGAIADLGPSVERVLPRELPAVGVDEGVLVVGRLSGKAPNRLTLAGGGETTTVPLRIVSIEDSGDLRRRWGLGRLEELLDEGASRAALVDIGRRFGIVSPYTSLYVPTEREAAKPDVAARESLAELQAKAIERRAWWRPWSRANRETVMAAASPPAALEADEKTGGTGTRAKGEEGAMGSPVMKESGRTYGVTPGQGAPAPRAAMAAPTQGTSQLGMLGLLSAPAGDPNAPPPPSALDPSSQLRMLGLLSAPARDPNAPPTPSALDPSQQLRDALKAQVQKSASSPSSGEPTESSFGAGGLAGAGTGEGGAGQGIGRGSGRLGAGHRAMGPTLREGAISVQGRLPSEVIGRIARQNFGRFRLCYENGIRNNPSLAGLVKVKFVIDRTGAVSSVADGGSNLPDLAVVQCIVRGFANLSFPQPEGGPASVIYPITFAPDEGPTPRAPPKPDLAPKAAGPLLAIIGHAPRPCGAAADLSLADRRTLWTERLTVSASANDIVVVYHRALEDCEAPTWQERTQLLLLMVDRLRTVTERVALWKMFIGTPAADVVYRAIVVRVQTVGELREFHQALGIATLDPDLLAGMLAKAKTAADRLSILRAAAIKWPNDLELALRVLDGYEDAGDENAGRAWARRLRRRPDATVQVWTSVGEYYLRLSAQGKGAAADRDALEGKRTFGELVEFAPEDPAARRRLGDLLRAHAWYEEAFRQYETLQQLTPDDPAVPLFLAAAAQGLGRIEEAVGWAEKAAAAGSPDGASELSRSARATASAFLAWARADALQSGRKDDADKLLARTRRLVGTDAAGQGGSIRFLVTWSHPELRPSLWTSALDAPSPAPDNFPFYGVAEARVAGSSSTPGIELHLDPDDAARAARLGARAIVTAITGEGTADERIARLDVGFGSAAAPSDRVKVDFDDGALRVEAP
jgi:Ca-activated chloride channel family protein